MSPGNRSISYPSVHREPATEWPEPPTIPPEVFQMQRIYQGIINAQMDILDYTAYPWKKRCTALVKCGPCALVLYRGGGE